VADWASGMCVAYTAAPMFVSMGYIMHSHTTSLSQSAAVLKDRWSQVM